MTNGNLDLSSEVRGVRELGVLLIHDVSLGHNSNQAQLDQQYSSRSWDLMFQVLKALIGFTLSFILEPRLHETSRVLNTGSDRIHAKSTSALSDEKFEELPHHFIA
jgi:hypothetical protein